MNTILEALHTLNLEEDAYNVSYKYITHFTDTPTTLSKIILRDQLLFIPGNYNSVSFSRGYAKNTGLPTQPWRLSGAGENKWFFGVQLRYDSLNIKVGDALQPFSDITEKLKMANTSDLPELAWLIKLSNKDCWLKLNMRFAPIKITQEMYDALRKKINNLDRSWLDTHSTNKEKELSRIQLLMIYYSAKKSKMPTIIESITFATESGRNHGPRLSIRQEDKNIWDDYLTKKDAPKAIKEKNEKIIDELQKDLDDVLERMENTFDGKERTIINNEKTKIMGQIERLKREIKNADKLLQTDSTKIYADKTPVLYIDPDTQRKLENSQSLNENELISARKITFDITDLDAVYIPDIWKPAGKKATLFIEKFYSAFFEKNPFTHLADFIEGELDADIQQYFEDLYEVLHIAVSKPVQAKVIVFGDNVIRNTQLD